MSALPLGPTVPLPSAALKDASERTEKDLRRLAFEGDTDAFRACWRTYLTEHSEEDPHGRLALNRVVLLNPLGGMLSFRSSDTDLVSFERNRRLRWSLWLEILPLDMQLALLFYEGTPRETPLIDWHAVRWEQCAAVENAPDPELAFRCSPLGGWRGNGTPGPGTLSFHGGTPETSDVPQSWEVFRGGLLANGFIQAARFVAEKNWAQLEWWMTTARLNPRARVSTFYIPYRNRSGSTTGAAQAIPVCPLPFWAAAVFWGAEEPDFWQAMERCGGPDRPETGRAWEERTTDPAFYTPTEAPPDFYNPMSWLNSSNDLERAGVVPEVAQRTAAAWRNMMLSQVMVPPAPARRAVRL